MAQSSNDILVAINTEGSTYLEAESMSELNTSDAMTAGIFSAGRFFEIESFNFGLKLKDEDKSKDKAKVPGQDKGRPAATGSADDAGTESFRAWRAMAGKTAAANAPQLFFARPDDLTITRMMDKASPVLVQRCLEGKQLLKVVLVKRGRDSTGTLTSFMKLTFTTVQITAIEWSDGELSNETCKFKFRAMAVEYNLRKPDGSKISSVNGAWSRAGG